MGKWKKKKIYQTKCMEFASVNLVQWAQAFWSWAILPWTSLFYRKSYFMYCLLLKNEKPMTQVKPETHLALFLFHYSGIYSLDSVRHYLAFLLYDIVYPHIHLFIYIHKYMHADLYIFSRICIWKKYSGCFLRWFDLNITYSKF